jgi:hypothetical protein
MTQLKLAQSVGLEGRLEEVRPVSALEMVDSYPELKPALVNGFLRETETCNIVAAAKIGKTHLAMDLALCVCSGCRWLGRFDVVSPGRVLYCDAELHKHTAARRLAAICDAKGLDRSQLAGIDVLSLRGKRVNIFGLGGMIYPGKYRLVVLDALYRLIPEGIDENSNSDMTRVFNCIDRMADESGAAVVVIHHTSKGSQANKSVTDTGSGASAMARAADSHLVLRHHKEPGCVVLEAAARSWPPLSPVVLRWEHPLYRVDDRLAPSDLRQEGKKRPAMVEDTWTPERFVSEFVDSEPKEQRLILARAKGLLSARKAQGLLVLAQNQGLVRLLPASGRKPARYAISTVGP